MWVVSAKIAIHRDQRFDRQAARLLTAFLAAHAVRDNRQPPLAQELLVVLRLPITEGILVVVAHAADVGLGRHFDSSTNLHPSAASMRGIKSGIGNNDLYAQSSNYIASQAGRSNGAFKWRSSLYIFSNETENSR